MIYQWNDIAVGSMTSRQHYWATDEDNESCCIIAVNADKNNKCFFPICISFRAADHDSSSQTLFLQPAKKSESVFRKQLNLNDLGSWSTQRRGKKRKQTWCKTRIAALYFFRHWMWSNLVALFFIVCCEKVKLDAWLRKRNRFGGILSLSWHNMTLFVYHIARSQSYLQCQVQW